MTRARAGFLALTLLLVAAAGAAAWFTLPARVPTAFQAPGLIHVVHEGGAGVAQDVRLVDGRILARKRLRLELRWLLDPVEIRADAPAGHVGLQLGGNATDARTPAGGPARAAGATLQLTPERASLRVNRADGSVDGWTRERTGAERYALRWSDGAYTALADGAPLGEPLPGDPPEGPAGVGLAAHASVGALHCRTADGTERSVGGAGPDGTARVVWATLGALLGWLALARWWAARGRGAGGAADKLLAAAVLAALLAGAWTTLHANNATRLLSPTPEASTEPFVLDGPRVLRPGEPFDTNPRLDADLLLEARLVLAPRTVVDVVLRGELPHGDGGLVVTLSSDPALPGGGARNLVRRFEQHDAPRALRVLAADEPHALAISCLGSELRARVDGEAFVEFVDHDLRAGRVALHVLAGEARLESLTLTPRPAPADRAGVLLRWKLGVCGALLAGLLLLAWVAGRGVAGVLWIAPVAVGLQPVAPRAALLPLGALALVLLLLTPRRGRRLAGVALGLLCLGVVAWTAGETAPDTRPATLNMLQVSDYGGEALPVEYAWARHPLLRRFSAFARAQRFREEQASLRPPPGERRVLALGSSSTFGYGVQAVQAWPARLEHHLGRSGRPSVNVLNAGVPGSVAARLALTLEGLLLRFAPEVVIVDLSFNDHIAGTMADESAHFARMTSTGIGPLERRIQQLEGWWRRRSRARFMAQRQRGAAEPGLVERHSLRPAEAFADELRRMVRATREAGAEILLIQEPGSPDADLALMEPFHAAMARVGAELDVPVLDLGRVVDDPALFIDAVHLSAEGNDRAAAAIARALLEGGLLPPANGR